MIPINPRLLARCATDARLTDIMLALLSSYVERPLWFEGSDQSTTSDPVVLDVFIKLSYFLDILPVLGHIYLIHQRISFIIVIQEIFETFMVLLCIDALP